MEAALAVALEWQQRGPVELGAEEGRRLEGPARSAVSQATPNAVGCSSTLATIDNTYPIGASWPDCDGVGGQTW
jgi:hypothetical protein